VPRINLGDLARDTVTGFTGIVVATTDWLANCRRLTLQPRELKDGKPIEALTFDEPHCAFIEYTELSIETAPANGGPMPEPVRTGMR
jgi:hypothetical protein